MTIDQLTAFTVILTIHLTAAYFIGYIGAQHSNPQVRLFGVVSQIAAVLALIAVIFLV